MISVGENKAALCKGDFHPAQLYKGDKKFAGYIMTEFQGIGSVTLENCYNDKVYDAFVQGKNLLDVNMRFPDYANGEGGISYTNSDFNKIYTVNMMSEYKEGVPYTISMNYDIEGEKDNSVSVVIKYTDGTRTNKYMPVNTSGSCVITSDKSKTIKNIILSFSASTKICNVKLTNMQIEEGVTATEYEPPLTEATITVREKNLLDVKTMIPFENGNLTADIPTLKGTTIIEVESDVPAIISGKYKRKEE